MSHAPGHPPQDPTLGILLGLGRGMLRDVGTMGRGLVNFGRGMVRQAVEHPLETAVDFSPVGDVKAALYDAPRAFGSGNTIGGMLALASAAPLVPNLAKGIPASAVRAADDLPMDEASRMARAREMGFDVDTPVYHGTGRPDRIGSAFSRERATSGPSAFFTDNPEIASNYAADKLDTSRINEGRSFSEMFKFRLDDGTEVPLDEAFSRLPMRERVALRNNLGRVTKDYDADDFALVMGEGPGGSSHWDYAMREARRNPLKAAEDVWLNSAILHGDEGRFVDVLQAAGLPPGRVRFDDPYAQYPGVVPAFIKPGEILETSNSDALSQLIRRLRNKPDTRNAEIDADMWSKDRWSTHEWADALEADLAAGENSFVWTSIPDAVSDEIEAMGFNTIKDVGGKSGGMGHNVYIPLRPNQIRSRFARFDPAQSESSNLMAGLMGLLGTGALLRANSGDRER